jgi:hypothetical protein
MGLDQFLNYSGWVIGVAGLGFAAWQYRVNQSRLVVREFRPGLRALTAPNVRRIVQVNAISIKVENKGQQSAKRSRLVHFARSTSLPLYPVSKGRVQQGDSSFVIEGNDEADLVAAWVLYDRAVGMGGIPYAEFVKDYLPATVVITIGKRTLKATLSEKEVTAFHQRFEHECFKMGA